MMYNMYFFYRSFNVNALKSWIGFLFFCFCFCFFFKVVFFGLF